MAESRHRHKPLPMHWIAPRKRWHPTLNVEYLEYRHMYPRLAGRPTKDLYVTFRKNIDPDEEKNMLAIPRKQRAMVRKGIKAGLHSTIDRDIERFYDAYSASVHRLGTPVFSKKYFRLLKEVFGEDCEILTITNDGSHGQ